MVKNLIYKNTFNKIKVDRNLLCDIILIKNIKTLIPPNVYQVYLDSVLTQKLKINQKIFKKCCLILDIFI